MSPVKSPQELSSPDIGKKDKLVVKKGEEDELPPGWEIEVKTRKGVNGTKRDRYYTDPVTGYIFRSLIDVQRYLKTGDLGKRAKKPKNTETDKKIVEESESKEQIMVSSTPLSETPSNKRPLEDDSVTKSKSESPQRASKQLAGVTIDTPPPPPSSSPPEPRAGKATRLSGIKTDAPPPPSPSPPVPKTRQATRLARIKVDPPPPLPPSSPPEPKTSGQVTARQAEEEAQTRPPVVLAISKEKDKKAETQKIKDNDGIGIGNADMASSKSPSTHEKVKSKANENQESHTVSPPPVSHHPIIPEKQPLESVIPIPMSDSHSHNKKQESPINFCLNDFWTDPCIEFAVKTLTGAIPFGDLNKVDNFPQSSPLEVPMEELWTDPCIEFAVKTLTGAIPVVGEDQTQVLSNNKQLDSVGNGGIQKSGNIGFHQQVNGSCSNNGQCSRPRFFQ